MTRALFEAAYEAARTLVAATPALAEFAPWPSDAAFVDRPANLLPASGSVAAWKNGDTPQTAALHDAVCAVALVADWRQTYTEAEVGAHFLANYGYFELVGPLGHFHAEGYRAYVAYWGAGLHYPWHMHEAEELYFVIAGGARFEAEGTPPAILGPGDTCRHASNQPHTMTTADAPILTLVLWRGSGLSGLPRMGRA
ncbi:MAG: cupin domain-containing protein [Hyphomicrobiales bacterium]|nr:cupin domain-containing protein [Hyphomicrobiales bacterium]